MRTNTEKTGGTRWRVSLPLPALGSLLGLAFLAGALCGILGLQPAPLLARGFQATLAILSESIKTRPEILGPIAHQGSGVVVNDPTRASPGLTVLQGLMPGGPQLRLIDNAGNELHRWNVDFFRIWPEPVHIDPAGLIPASSLHYHTQGFHVRPDGSVLVDVGGLGAVNLDKCSEVLWTIDRMAHHSVTPAADGGYYLPAHKPISQIDARLISPMMTRDQLVALTIAKGENTENLVLKVDAEGRSEHEFSVLEALTDAGLEDVIHVGWMIGGADPTHLNDIEVVTPALAAKIAGVEPGDLLISLRNVNMLAILDRRDGTLKWQRRGPWVRQHDPDITPDGRIELFNNRSIATGGLQDSSQILRYDPGNDSVEVLHPKGQKDRFQAIYMGSHQLLPNGNRLIVESTAGRVFEATPEGDVVWSFVLPYDEEYAALIEDAGRVPEGFFSVTDWTCP